MLPTTNPTRISRNSASRGRPAVDRPAPKRAQGQPPAGDAKAPLGPIGPERLRALREAIENGTYPTEADVLGGLDRLLGIPSGDEAT